MNIETQALKIYSKPSKPQVVALLESLYETANDDDKHALATVYSHYVAGIKPAKKAKSNFEWVAKAVSKDTTRYYLHHVYADGKHIVATDGHRMHWVEDTRPVGFYCAKTEKALDASECGTFPDWQRVIPDFKTEHTATLDLKDVTAEGKLKTVKLREKHVINHKYLSDALNGENEASVTFEDGTAIRIENLPENRQAVIMALRN